MFKVGDMIIYGNIGVCTVEKIGSPDLKGVPAGKDYYTLVPYYSRRSRIFIACDNDKVIMRPLISKEKAEELIENIDSIATLDIKDEKNRELIYKETMKSCDCREFVSIIKTIWRRRQERIAEGKKTTASDEKYFGMAEDKLYGELAIALDMNKEKVRDYIADKVES